MRSPEHQECERESTRTTRIAIICLTAAFLGLTFGVAGCVLHENEQKIRAVEAACSGPIAEQGRAIACALSIRDNSLHHN